MSSVGLFFFSYSCSPSFLMSEYFQPPVKGRLPFTRVMSALLLPSCMRVLFLALRIYQLSLLPSIFLNYITMPASDVPILLSTPLSSPFVTSTAPLSTLIFTSNFLFALISTSLFATALINAFKRLSNETILDGGFAMHVLPALIISLEKPCWSSVCLS